MSQPVRDGSRLAARAAVVGAVAWALGVVLVLALFWQSLDVYFVLGGEEVQVTAAQETRYVWTAAACVASMAVALVCAMVRWSRWLGVGSVLGLVVALAAAVVFAVPSDRWHREPERYEPPANDTPCYSGEDGCGPGG